MKEQQKKQCFMPGQHSRNQTIDRNVITKYIQTLELRHNIDSIVKTNTALEECVTQLKVNMPQPIILRLHLQHLGQQLGPRPFQLCGYTWQEHPALLSRNVLLHRS